MVHVCRVPWMDQQLTTIGYVIFDSLVLGPNDAIKKKKSPSRYSDRIQVRVHRDAGSTAI